MHVGFLLLLGFGLLATLRAKTTAGRALFWTFGVLGFLTGVYQWVEYAPLLHRSGFLTPLDVAVGTVLIVLVFEAARRLMGWPLAIISGVFLAYCFLGNHLPPPFIHRGYDFVQIVDYFAFGTEGIYGTPVYVSAAYIFIFVVFAAFLERAGMIALFNDVALGLVGSWRGGPAQVCVLSSALMGTISGSGVANVVASGQFTIPLMKRFGFRAAFAGGVEATSSMGGQIMPPVMGAVAFIMAETLNIPYADVVKAAIIPAILYFGACFWQVHLEAGKAGLGGMRKEELPSAWNAIKQHWPLVLPLAALVYLLFAGYTPIFAGTMGLALTVVLILGAPLAALIGPFAFRVVFWIALGLAAAAFMRLGVNVLALVIGALVAACLAFKGGRETLVHLRRLAGRGGEERAAGRHRLRHRRHRHRHADLDRHSLDLDRRHHHDRREQPVPVAGSDHAHLPGARHGHPDDPELHHHLVARRPGAARTRRAALGQPHVRLLFRHHGRPDAAGRAGRFRGGADGQGIRAQDRHPGVEARHCRLRRALHGGLYARTDAAGSRADGAELRLFRRGRLYRRESLPGYRALGCRRGRLPRRSPRFLGADHRFRRRRAAGARPAAHRRDRLGPRRSLDRLALVAGETRRDCAAMSLCILAAGKTTVLAVTAFTLSWTHSVEKTRWEEDWRVTPAGLEIVEASVKGSGAGMEPPEGAVLKDGWWVYRPKISAQPVGHACGVGRDGRRLDSYARLRPVWSLERKPARRSSFRPARSLGSEGERRGGAAARTVDGSVKGGGRAEGAHLPARAGGAGAAHIVALGAIGRRDELAQRKRKMRDVIPDHHGTRSLSLGCPFRLRTCLAFSRE